MGWVDSEATDLGVAVGDEILNVDGQSPDEILAIINTYLASGNEGADAHNLDYLTTRTYPMASIHPKDSQAQIQLRRPDNSTYTVYPTWKVRERSGSDLGRQRMISQDFGTSGASLIRVSLVGSRRLRRVQLLQKGM